LVLLVKLTDAFAGIHNRKLMGPIGAPAWSTNPESGADERRALDRLRSAGV
jgi:hypothetical protein